MATDYTATRTCLHALAELVLAGPRYRSGGTIKLRAYEHGVRTWDDPLVALSGGALVTDEQSVPLDGLTYAEAARRVGLVASRLDDLYSDGTQAEPTERVRLATPAARQVEEALWLGARALRSFHHGAEPVVWPEHFDVALTVDEVNYGVSPGDGYSPDPYAYVGPHREMAGDFWNAPFGAARRLHDLGDVATVAAFFRRGAELVSSRGDDPAVS
jgi:hypothetical protein